MSGHVIKFPQRGWEPWVTKQQLANHLGYTTRWVEYRITEGLPFEQFCSRKRFRITEVEQWLRERSAA